MIGRVLNKGNYKSALEYMKKSGKSAADVARIYKGVDARTLASMAESVELDEGWKVNKDTYFMGKDVGPVHTHHSGYSIAKIGGKWIISNPDDEEAGKFKSLASAKSEVASMVNESARERALTPSYGRRDTYRDKMKRGANELKKQLARKRGEGEQLKLKFEDLRARLGEKLTAKDDAGEWVKDFQDSDAPQFKGKSDEKKRKMAIAAFLDAKRKAKNEEVQLDEVTVNYNHLKKAWVTRKDPVNGKFFKPSGNVKNLVLQNATWIIDDEAVANGDRVFAYIKGDRASKLPDGYKARPLGFKADQNAPFFHRDDKSVMKKADYVVFNDKGATAYYKDKVNEEAGAGEEGTDKLVKKYKKDTPHA